MRIYIAEDDPSVIGVLEDILESSALGRVCGASEEGAPDPERIMVLDPDLVLVDLLMPGRDGIQLVRELKELGSRAKFVMISQVSAKELIAKAYQAGVEFFIQKPINLIEVRQVLQNVIRQIQNERALRTIQSVFVGHEPPQPQANAYQQESRRIKYTLSQLGMAGEKGSQDISQMCLHLLEQGQTASQVGVSTLCAQLSSAPKTMEQRARRAVERGLSHIASLGLEDYANEIFTRYSARLFSFQEVRAEMVRLQGKGPGGKVNLKKFLDGLLILAEEE